MSKKFNNEGIVDSLVNLKNVLEEIDIYLAEVQEQSAKTCKRVDHAYKSTVLQDYEERLQHIDEKSQEIAIFFSRFEKSIQTIQKLEERWQIIQKQIDESHEFLRKLVCYIGEQQAILEKTTDVLKATKQYSDTIQKFTEENQNIAAKNQNWQKHLLEAIINNQRKIEDEDRREENTETTGLQNIEPTVASEEGTSDIENSNLIDLPMKEAENGDVEAQNKVGDCYYWGLGVKQNYEKSVEWYQKAADAGLAKAQNNLGNCYYNGQGVKQNYRKAIKWYQQAAEQDDDAANHSLGDCYYWGYGVRKNYRKAVEFYQKSAQQGNVEAQKKLGACYYDGNGVKKDYVQAATWYRQAADQNDAVAQYLLGNCYAAGDGVTQDHHKAVLWYLKSAEQGYKFAQNSLGDCYYHGIGVKQNKQKAITWYQRAAEQGDKVAQNHLKTWYHLDDTLWDNQDKKSK